MRIVENGAPNGAGIYGLPFTVADAKVVVIPVPFDATTPGGGPSRGPRAVLDASQRVELYDREIGHPHSVGIAMLEIPKKIGRWNEEGRRFARRMVAKRGAND